MNPIEIANTIGDMIQNNTNQTIISVFNRAFDETNQVKQFKLRSLFVDEINKAVENTSKTKHILKSFEDICLFLTHPRLNENISVIANKFTSSHIANIEQAFDIKNYSDEKSIEEIAVLNEDLKKIIETEDITIEEKNIILAICNDIDVAKFEYKIMGNSTLKKLYDNITDKLIINSEILMSIDSNKLINKLSEIYRKIEKSNKIMNTFISISDKATKIMEFLDKNPTILSLN